MMHLKFPLPTGYFPKFELTPDETLAYKELVTDLVKDTRREHETYVKESQRHVDSRKWKLAKTKDRLHIYKRRSEYGATAIGLTGHSHGGGSSSSGSYDHNSSSAFRSGSESSSNGFSLSSTSTSNGHMRSRVSSTLSNSSSHSSNHNASSGDMSLGVLDEASTTGLNRRLIEPTYLATGVIDGSVDDIIYGFHEATADASKTTAALVGDDQLIDTVVLHTIKSSKTTYLGLKWKLCRTPGGNRDMCFIEYVGVANDAKGERYGFKVIESVKLRNCPAFDDNSIIRTNVSFRYLFRESGTPGIVDVYMQGAFDSSGDAVTAGGVGDARSTMEILMEVETRLDIAESKKLADLVAAQARAPPKPKQSGSQCSICRAKPGLLSSHLLCQGCGAVICTKCRMKKVVIVVKRGAASKNKVSCCKICLVNAKETSPFAGEAIPTPQQPLRALQKKSSVSSMTPHGRSGSAADQGPLATTQELALALPQSKQLERHRGGDSFVDTEYSGSMQSWQSSSVSSSYSDLDDSYGSSHMSPGGQLALVHHKMPRVAESPRVRSHRGHLPQYAHQGHQSQQQAVGMYNQNHQQQQAMYNQTQHHHHHHQAMGMYNQGMPQGNNYGRAPPPPMHPHGNGMGNADQHRMGLYNQMVELQMKAERAQHLANQNAAFMQQRQ